MPPERIRVADPSPACCSACYQAKPGMLHIDLGAAFDGPMVMAAPRPLGDGRYEFPDRTVPHNGVIGVVGTPIDDLVICFECIKRAAELCGMTFEPELLLKIKRLEEANDSLHDHADDVRAGVTTALKAAARKAEQPAPQLVGTSSPLIAGSQIPPSPARRRARERV